MPAYRTYVDMQRATSTSSNGNTGTEAVAETVDGKQVRVRLRSVRSDRMVPAWLRKSRLWLRALAVASDTRPPTEAKFIHRDYHPENSLWSRGRLTGIVDWTQASIGPPEVDVGHMRLNLVASYGQTVDDQFRDLYESVVGRKLSDQPRWDLVTLMDLSHQWN